MNRDELNQLLKEMLREDACWRGWVPYSGLDTLKQGDYYFMGYNPGEGWDNGPLLETTNNLKDWSAYTQQCWRCCRTRCKHAPLGECYSPCRHSPCEHMECSGRLREDKRKRHQNNVIKLMRLLGREPERIFSANAIFIESSKAKDLQDADRLWQKCWRVHQKFLALVRPKWVVCLGNGEELSSFQLMKQMATKPVQKVLNPCNPDCPPHYRTGKLLHASFDLGDAFPLNDVNLLGVPHPTRFTISDSLEHFIVKNVR